MLVVKLTEKIVIEWILIFHKDTWTKKINRSQYHFGKKISFHNVNTEEYVKSVIENKRKCSNKIVLHFKYAGTKKL